MRVLVTGSLGYVAGAVIPELRRSFPDCTIVGVDAGWFAPQVIGDGRAPETMLDQQIFTDIRDIGVEAFRDVTHVVHLAAISNDPMGDRFADLTDDINFRQSARLATLAHDCGVRSFVFASSASVYGVGGSDARHEGSELAPVTAYARSKIATEQALSAIADADFSVTCLRFSTACGPSPRLRLDLVLNDFVASAVSTGRIDILSDGTPWRPLIHVRDMARAIVWALSDDRSDLDAPAVISNVGREDWNFQIRDLATAVSAVMGGVELSISRDAPADKRSYRVDFSHWREIAPNHQPAEELALTIAELSQQLKALPGLDPSFRSGRLIRLHTLNALQLSGALQADLRWARA